MKSDTEKEAEEDIRRLTFAVIFMSIVVLLLYGLAPSD